MEKVSDVYPTLYHYTTTAGIEGIVRTQQLRATHIRYLNDSEEFVGFFGSRLKRMLLKPIGDAVNQLYKNPATREIITEGGGVAKATVEILEGICKSMADSGKAFHQPFVTSFCSPPKNRPDNGLLSQWRAYGTDGGYAIVFESKELEKLLGQEISNFHYQFGNWGDVDYDDEGDNLIPSHPERMEWEDKLKAAIHKFVFEREPRHLEEVYELIAFLACRHKHQGFSEEREVRIVVIPTNDEIYKLAFERGVRQPRKAVHFAQRGGVLMPHIYLFGAEVDGKSQRLPIKQIIVGPHPEKEKRLEAVKLLLKQYDVDAEVVASRIPYIGH